MIPHVIEKQTIALKIDRGLNAFQVQNQMSKQYWEQIIGTLEKIFDECCKEEETMEVAHMEIDLGIYSEHELQQGKEELESLMREQIIRFLQSPADKRPIRTISRSYSICEQWLYFIRTGHLSWNTIKVHETWKHQVLETLATDHASIHELQKTILRDPSVARRIYLQYHTSMLLALVEVITAQRHRELKAAIEELYQWEKHVQIGKKLPPTSRIKFMEDAWTFVLREAAGFYHGKGSSKQLLAPRMHGLLSKVVKANELRPKVPARFTVLAKWYTKEISMPDLGAEVVATAPEAADAPGSAGDPSREIAEVAPSEQGLFVAQAGLVILHPFLTSIFKRLKLVKEGAFLHPEARNKAMMLLNFMATGETEAPEYHLVMSKLLCGIPLQEPVPRKVRLSKKAQQEAMLLLEMIIQRWEVLKNTSIEGLRLEFLQRTGKLSLAGDRSKLQIEGKASDVLLDHLPWNISLIKLPWMKEMLQVEWR